MKYGYIRVSTKEQKEDRQIIALSKCNIKEGNIFIDKESGKDFNRKNYKRPVKKVRKGDVIIIKSIDRLGRNYNEIIAEYGTTYLPVRAVGEAFNKAVDWDGSTSSVYIGTKPFISAQPTVLLEDLDYFTKTAYIGELDSEGWAKDNTGTVHNSGYLVDDYGGDISIK